MAPLAGGEARLGPRASFTRYMVMIPDSWFLVEITYANLEQVRDSIAKLLTRLHKEGKLSTLPGFEHVHPPSHGEFNPRHLPRRQDHKSKALPTGTKVCIVGAGISGLYSALILDHLGVPYDILEAADRPGGRILTHYFSTKEHDYYDIGAMRFPNIPPMERYVMTSVARKAMIKPHQNL